MQVPLRVTFHDLTPSEAIESAIRRWVTRLEHLHARIVHCDAWVDLAHHHGRDPRYRIRLAIGLPGTEITVSHESGHGNVQIAITEAFVAAQRQIHEHLHASSLERRAG